MCHVNPDWIRSARRNQSRALRNLGADAKILHSRARTLWHPETASPGICAFVCALVIIKSWCSEKRHYFRITDDTCITAFHLNSLYYIHTYIYHHIIPFIDSFFPSHLHSSSSSGYTEATMLFSRQSTLDDLDDVPQNVPKTSERARPKLHKMYGVDASYSSADSGSSNVSRFIMLLCILIHLHCLCPFLDLIMGLIGIILYCNVVALVDGALLNFMDKNNTLSVLFQVSCLFVFVTDAFQNNCNLTKLWIIAWQ